MRGLSDRPHVVVIGAGIAGLAAAYRLVQDGVLVTVLERDERIGGKILNQAIGCIGVDLAEDTLLEPADSELNKHRKDGKDQGNCGSIEGDVQTGRQLIHRVSLLGRKCSGVELAEGLRNPQHGSQEAEHRHRPVDDA